MCSVFLQRLGEMGVIRRGIGPKEVDGGFGYVPGFPFGSAWDRCTRVLLASLGYMLESRIVLGQAHAWSSWSFGVIERHGSHSIA